jgi:hypothetical protein
MVGEKEATKKICDTCRINLYPHVQFCDFCKHEIRKTIVDSTGSPLNAVDVVRFDAIHKLGMHLLSWKWCSNCYDQVKRLQNPNVEFDYMCRCGDHHPFGYACENCLSLSVIPVDLAIRIHWHEKGMDSIDAHFLLSHTPKNIDEQYLKTLNTKERLRAIYDKFFPY